MAVLRKGEIFLLLLLLIFVSFPSRFRFFACCSTPSEHEHGNEHEQEPEPEAGSRDDILTVSDRQEIQLKKLETLIENLTETVARLESSLCGIGSFATVEKEQRKAEKPAQLDYSESDKYSRMLSDFETKGKPVVSGREGGITVTKYKPPWSERFQFLSAIRLESEATCINILPYEDYEGSSKYVAVGDERGWVYIFLSNGDVLVEFKTLSDSPITSMLSYMSVWKNESFLVTGHRDGAILVHRVWEAANGEDWHSLSMGKLREIVLPEKSEEDFSVINLEVHNVGRIRYILSSDVSGRIKVFRENGTLYGIATSLSRPLVFLKQRLLFLTENGVGSLDLRRMTVRESECEGLNGSLVKNYVFDSSERSKAYGFTSEGDLIHVVLLGDMTNFKCMVRAKRKSEMDGSLAVQTVKGYLLVISHEKVFVYNVSSPSYNIRLGGPRPRPLFYATLDEIKASFINSPVMPESSESRKPLISTDREKLVVLGLGNGYVGIYRSNLPVFKAEFSTVLWSSPVVLCVLFLIGAWQFLGKKREFVPWNPDDPLSATSMTTGVQLGSGSGERSYQDSSRDVRGGALMGGPPRRYASPNRYPAATNTSFRPSSSDPSFRTGPELKYRGQNLDIAGFQKRRDPLFSNNQVVEDNVD
ncbi:hypothetical protein MRB53_014414 [Persea americana]|uniref:Uncharacterized protein n=1 Tax=Persea americana TaxID=3435 RepID=A0ACC2KAZ0_PERAE|nr:hypothetical protein MRB53_014414 [Persea americana]